MAAHCLVVAVAAVLALWRPAPVEERIEGPLLDLRFHARNAWWQLTGADADWRRRPRAGGGSATPSPRVVVVAIDKASEDRYGAWPWHSVRVGALLHRIASGGPRAIAIALAPPGEGEPWEDRSFVEALSGLRGRVAVGVDFRTGTARAGEDPAWLGESVIARVEQPRLLEPLEAAGPLPGYGPAARAASVGHARYERDGRGVARREVLYLRYDGAWVPSLALQAARLAEGLAPGAVGIRGDGSVSLGGTTIPADRRGRLTVNYYGPEGSLPRYAATAVLEGDTDPGAFEGAVVFVGTTGIASYDLVGTPFTDELPDVERSATVAANILRRDFRREASPGLNVLVVLAAGAAVPLLCRGRRGALSLLALAALAAALAAGATGLFLRGVDVALCYPLALVLATGGATVARQFQAQRRVARRMRGLFSSYVTERVVERLIADPAMARLGGERREVSILFADIRGFTGFSEKHPPERVVATLNEYLGAMTEVVFRWEGTLDKFIGDTILAFWGAPLPQEDHAERALRCALHLCSRLDRLNAAWTAAGRPPLEIGVGVTSGTVLVGNIGAEGKKMDYTVIGDQVNLCSRVEELTKPLRARILIAAGTFERLRPLLAGRGFGHVILEGPVQVAVKGREEAVGVYRVTPRDHGEPSEVIDGGDVPQPAG